LQAGATNGRSGEFVFNGRVSTRFLPELRFAYSGLRFWQAGSLPYATAKPSAWVTIDLQLPLTDLGRGA
jgi:hypothetical protein